MRKGTRAAHVAEVAKDQQNMLRAVLLDRAARNMDEPVKEVMTSAEMRRYSRVTGTELDDAGTAVRGGSMSSLDVCLSENAVGLYTSGDVEGACLIAPTLKCEVGEIVTDITVLDIEVIDHPEWGEYPCLILKWTDADRNLRINRLHALHYVLRDTLAAHNIQIGDTIRKLVCLGKSDNHDYWTWRVLVTDPSAKKAYAWTKRTK